MFSIIQAEWYKLRKTKGMLVWLAGPLVGLAMGLLNGGMDLDPGVNAWYLQLVYSNIVYALLFLPLITAVLASLICRYEHQAGGWKHLLALPITRGQLFVAKYSLLLFLVFVMQILYMGSIYLAGKFNGFADPFPLAIVWKSIFGGWVAAFPLLALQLGLSILFRSFAIPLAINVIFTLPTLLVVNSNKVAPYYPWAQPFSMMYIREGESSLFYVPWDQLLTVVGGSFVLFFLGSYLYFQRKAV
ncbi:ABC transporter permease [Paenibacillus senegalensis]|uniref:ABC transporter permease n=1 Tax=Paenibacillus senegalensis TaxID=1465766 RepID=UPI000288B202|nr:ABC transporter permease [Paenibacillus senegalensis]